MKKTCNSCGEVKTPSTVPYQVLADFKEMHKSTVKRLWILILVLVVLLAGCNIGWLIYESQYETIDYSYAQDGSGTNIIGNSNEVNNGAETES